MALIPEASFWSYDAQSMIYLELMKTPAPYFWENMWSDIFYEPPNQYFWFEMQTRFKDVVGKTLQLLDQREYNREEKEEEESDLTDIQIANNRVKL